MTPAGALAAVLAAVFVPMLINELGELSPWLAGRLLRMGARSIGPAGESYLEAWLKRLEVVPGKVTKLLWAAHFVVRTVPRLRAAHRPILGRRSPRGRSARIAAGLAMWTVLGCAGLTMVPLGRVAYFYFFAYAEFYAGVVALVSLSVSVMLGLAATDRLILSPRHRLRLQAAHRTYGVVAVASLGVHVATKVSALHVGPVDIVVPFLSPANTLPIGLGTVAGLLIVLILWTGFARARFIGFGRPGLWRPLHALSYLAWPTAVLHGLSAGRSAGPWVLGSYGICLVGVALALLMRLWWSRRRAASAVQ